MSSSVRATGARARQEALRTLLIAAAAFVGAGLLLAACSGTADTSSGGGAAAPAPHQGRVPGARGAANGAGMSGQSAAGSPGKAVYGGASAARLALSTQSIIYTAE